jgi:hypothetical protein
MLKKLGIDCEVLGPAVNYHGKRYPVAMDPMKIMKSVEKKHPEIWKILTKNGELVRRMEMLLHGSHPTGRAHKPRPH